MTRDRIRDILCFALGAALAGCTITMLPDPPVQHMTYQQRTDLYHAHADALGSGALQ